MYKIRQKERDFLNTSSGSIVGDGSRIVGGGGGRTGGSG